MSEFWLDPANRVSERVSDDGLLAAGDFAGAARGGWRGDWRQAAALGLIGGGQAALDRLAGFDDPLCRLFHAIALWIDGQDSGAEAMLGELTPSPAARHLRHLLQRERHNVLAFLPERTRGPHALLAGCRADSRFDVRNCGFHAEAAQGCLNSVNADIHKFYSRRWTPDFLICLMVEWHLLPRNLCTAPFFKVGHTSDFDLHAQEVMPWLRMFDAVVTLDHSELSRLRRALPTRVTLNYPKVFAVDTPGPVAAEERPIDVLITGTVASEFHQDKNELIARLVSWPGLRCVLLNGFVDYDEYCWLVRRAKLVVSCIRHPGTMPTRAVEAAALGTWCLVQDESVLLVFLPEDAAVLPYRIGAWDELAADVAAFVNRFSAPGPQRDELLARAERTRAVVCRDFTPARVASQYLRFCAALPAITSAIGLVNRSHPIAASDFSTLLQRRGNVIIGWLPADGDDRVMRRVLASNLEIADRRSGWSGYNEAGRERLIEFARLEARGYRRPALLKAALISFEAAIAAESRALAPRFNLIRAGFHFGDAGLRHRVSGLAHETLALIERGVALLTDDDDLLPYDFYPTHFNAPRASDLRMDAMGGDTAARDRLVVLVAASIHYYLGRAAGNDPSADVHYRAATTLDTGLPQYHVGYAQYLLGSRSGDTAAAAALLGPLVGSRIWTPELQSLWHLIEADLGQHRSIDRGGRLLFLEFGDEVARQSRYGLARCLTMTGERCLVAHQSRTHPVARSLIISGPGVLASTRLAAAIRHLRAAVTDLEIVLADTMLDARGAFSPVQPDTVLSVPQPGALAYSLSVIHEALLHVQTPWVIVLRPNLIDFERVLARLGEVLSSGLVHSTDDDGQGDNQSCLLVFDDAQAPDRRPELLAVGVPVAQARGAGLLHRSGALQHPDLALPILLHHLQGLETSYLVVDLSDRPPCTLPSSSPQLTLGQLVHPVDRCVLAIISPDWRRLDPSDSDSAVRAATPSGGSPQGSGGGIMMAGHGSLAFFVARAIYRRLFVDSNGQPTSFISRPQTGGLALRLGCISVEYRHPSLRVKVRIPFLRKSRRPAGQDC